jgi:hypothetical protein
MGSSVMDTLKWEGNSQKMFKTIMDSVPPLFKGMVKSEIEKGLVKSKVTVVTEELVIKTFKEKAPKPMWEKIDPQLESMKTGK